MKQKNGPFLYIKATQFQESHSLYSEKIDEKDLKEARAKLVVFLKRQTSKSIHLFTSFPLPFS